MTPEPRAHDLGVDAGHVYVTVDLEVPGRAPDRLVDGIEIAARDRARVVDQNVDRAGRTEQAGNDRAVAQIQGMNGDVHAGSVAKLIGRPVQVGAGARDQVQINALFRQRLRHRPADPPRAAGDQRALALQAQFHAIRAPKPLPRFEKSALYQRH